MDFPLVKALNRIPKDLNAFLTECNALPKGFMDCLSSSMHFVRVLMHFLKVPMDLQWSCMAILKDSLRISIDCHVASIDFLK